MMKVVPIRTLAHLLLAAMLTSLAWAAWANPPMVPRVDAQRAFAGNFPSALPSCWIPASRRMCGEQGIDVPREDSTSVPTEDVVWYLCALSAKISDATGVLVTVGRTTPAQGQAEGPLVKRYYLLSHPREQHKKNG